MRKCLGIDLNCYQPLRLTLPEDEFGVTGKMKTGTEQGKEKVIFGIL